VWSGVKIFYGKSSDPWPPPPLPLPHEKINPTPQFKKREGLIKVPKGTIGFKGRSAPYYIHSMPQGQEPEGRQRQDG
jgi:hypothetical protein